MLSSIAPRNRHEDLCQGTGVTSPLRGSTILSFHIGESPHQDSYALNSPGSRLWVSHGGMLALTGVPMPDSLIGYTRYQSSEMTKVMSPLAETLPARPSTVQADVTPRAKSGDKADTENTLCSSGGALWLP